MLFQITSTTKVNLDSVSTVGDATEEDGTIQLYWSDGIVDGTPCEGISIDGTVVKEDDLLVFVHPEHPNYRALLLWIKANCL